MRLEFEEIVVTGSEQPFWRSSLSWIFYSFYFVFSIAFSTQDCPNIVFAEQILLLFPAFHCPTPPRGKVYGKGHSHPLWYFCSVTKWGWDCVLVQMNLLVKELIYAQIGQIAFPSSLNLYHAASEPEGSFRSFLLQWIFHQQIVIYWSNSLWPHLVCGYTFGKRNS